MATIANLVVNLTANTADLFAPVDKASAKLARNMQRMSQSLTTAGKGLTAGLTLPIVGFGVGALKAASDFESSFAGVEKTVNATREELDGLAMGFRNMAKEIPISVNELNRVGEAAGQLGIKTENILSFSKTMALLGVTTNMASEEAATSLAQLANITSMSQEDFDRLGSTVAGLGNNLATTEADIVEFGLRIAGAGTQIGLSEAQILGIGGALASVGIKAEAGGTAISKVMISMAAAVDGGGEELESFADVAGVSSESFRKSFEEDAANALVAFVQGLGSAEERGKSMLGVIAELGIKEHRLRDTLLRAASASDKFSEAIQLGTQSWKDNNALTNEAEQRFKTFESQLILFKNGINDVAIALGIELMPAAVATIEKFKEWIPQIKAAVTWFKELSPAMKKTILVVAGLVAAIGPLLLAVGTLMGGIAALIALGFSGALLGWTAALAAVGVAVAGVVTYFEGWTVIGDTLEWLGDRVKDFGQVVSFAISPIGAVLGNVVNWFQGASDEIVGHSIVPEMVDLIEAEFDRMGVAMEDRTEEATLLVAAQFQVLSNTVMELPPRIATMADAFTATIPVIENYSATLVRSREAMAWVQTGVFQTEVSMLSLATKAIPSIVSSSGTATEKTVSIWGRMGANLNAVTSNIGDTFMSAFTGGGGALGAIKSLATQGAKSLMSMIPVVGPFLAQFAGPLIAGLGKIGSTIKGWFGGPDKHEISGREAAASFRTNIASMLSETQRMEAGTDEWKLSVIGVRDAFIAAGRTEQEALAIMDQLWKAEKKGAGAVEEVIRQIEDVMRTKLTPSIKDSGKEFLVMTDSATQDIKILGHEVDELKIGLTTPVVIPIIPDMSNMPTQEWLADYMNASGGERSQFGSMSDDDLWDLFQAFAGEGGSDPGDWHRIPSGFGVSSSRLRRMGVPGFAHGGIVNRPTLAMIGEAGPEAVIPLTGSGGQFGGSRSNVHDDELHQEMVALRRDLPRAIGLAVQDAMVLAT